jgi:hypothetical protein
MSFPPLHGNESPWHWLYPQFKESVIAPIPWSHAVALQRKFAEWPSFGPSGTPTAIHDVLIWRHGQVMAGIRLLLQLEFPRTTDATTAPPELI